jgi:hypothetical protein
MILREKRTERRAARSDEVIVMKAQTQSNSTAEHAGAAVGRAWRRWLRQEHRLIDGLVSNGLPATTAKALVWIVKLLALAVLLHMVSWLVLLIGCAVGGAWVARNASDDDEATEWAIGEQSEHKHSLFYDPINYNDAPDPRFDDE